ncbi:MAG TPA: ComF family protein [Thermodesulfobacteriota bacterium]|nr:ComF family protein [Thermodesulfobacteriota bacterium]
MLDFIFPNVCTFCESASKNGIVCDTCLADIEFMKGRAVCRRCGIPFVAESTPDHLCGRCLQEEFYFDKARSVAFYDGLLRDMLHKFKYQGKLSFGSVLSRILIQNFPDDFDAVDDIVPVPLYINRLRSREYNQSVILGSHLAKHLTVSFNPFVLKRVRDTKPQFEIKSEDERRQNVKGAFSVLDSDKVRKKSILLIDDVFTTGSTIDECARVLLKAGASQVQAVTLMRAV